jgi:hypothetical protein
MGKPSPRNTRSLSARAGVSVRAYLLLLLFALALFWPLCVGRALYWGDIVLYFAPMWRWEQQGLQHGHIPLWNPAVLGGQPFVGNPQEGVFYPATLLLPFVPVWLYLSVMTITHVFLCGAFMARYLSRWTRHRLAPIAGGLVYMGSECLIGRVQFPPMIFTAAYLPLLLCSLDGCLDADKADKADDLHCSCKCARLQNPLQAVSQAVSEDGRLQAQHHSRCVLCRRARLASRLKLALVVGLLALAAHPQMAYLILACGSVYAMARYAAQYRHHQPIPIRQAMTVPLAGLLGLLLTAAQTLPAVQLLLASPREQLTPAQSNRFVLEPINLLTLVLPRFRGHPATADFWGGGNAWEPALFIGWLPLLLIGLACADGWRRKRTRFWVVGALLGIWLSFGSVGGLYWLAFKTVPGLSNFHDPARFLIYTTFAFAFLTAMGWDALAGRIRAFLLRTARAKGIPNTGNAANAACVLALVMLILPLWWYGRQWNPTAPHDFLDRRPSSLSALLFAIGSDDRTAVNRRVYLPAHDALWKHYITDGYSDYGLADDRHLQAFLETLLPNIGMADGLRSASGYEPVPVAAHAALDGLGRLALKRGEPNLTRLMAMMGADVLLLPATSHLTDARLLALNMKLNMKLKLGPKESGKEFRDDRIPRRQATVPFAVSAWRSMKVLPSAWIVHNTRRIEGKSRIVAALAAPDFQPETVAIVSDASQTEEPDLEWTETSREIRSSYQTLGSRNLEGVPANGGRAAEQTSCSLRKINADTTDQEYEATAGAGPGMLVLSQAAYPGWKATIDGKPSRPHRVDGALIGVYLSPGHHIVRITYRPDTYRFGLFLTLCVCSILCAGVGMWSAMRPLSNQTPLEQLKQLEQ